MREGGSAARSSGASGAAGRAAAAAAAAPTGSVPGDSEGYGNSQGYGSAAGAGSYGEDDDGGAAARAEPGLAAGEGDDGYEVGFDVHA